MFVLRKGKLKYSEGENIRNSIRAFTILINWKIYIKKQKNNKAFMKTFSKTSIDKVFDKLLVKVESF